jgi:hypothetical protein
MYDTCNVTSHSKRFVLQPITFRSMCAVPNLAVFSGSLMLCSPGTLLGYFLHDFQIVPVAPVDTWITFVLTFDNRCTSIVCYLYFKTLRLLSWSHFSVLNCSFYSHTCSASIIMDYDVQFIVRDGSISFHLLIPGIIIIIIIWYYIHYIKYRASKHVLQIYFWICLPNVIPTLHKSYSRVFTKRAHSEHCSVYGISHKHTALRYSSFIWHTFRYGDTLPRIKKILDSWKLISFATMLYICKRLRARSIMHEKREELF